jgi:flagellar protein FliS
MSVALQIRFSIAPPARSSTEGGQDADPHGFIGVLMEGALQRIRDAREQLAYGPDAAEWTAWAGPARLLRTAKVILGELRADLDLAGGGAFAANLDDLYSYMGRRLRSAELADGLAALDEVAHLLEALRTAWTFMPAEVRKASRN